MKGKLLSAAPFLRDIVFGVHDALLTNIGIIAGFVAAFQSNQLIVITALIDIFVSAFAMAFGTYLSRTSETAYLKGKLEAKTNQSIAGATGNPITASVVMWVTYVIAGFIPLLPFSFGLPPQIALRYTILLTFLVFAAVGILKGKLTETGMIKGALQFVLFGATAALIGYAIGSYGQQFLGIHSQN